METHASTDERPASPTIQLFSGQMFPVLDPRAALIEIDDIAASLSKVCRFGGHCLRYYSVAQHSVLVSRLVPQEDALWGLLHDAAECYIGDIARPMKIALQQLAPGVVRTVEHNILRAVAERFGLCGGMPASVHHADAVALATERRDLMAASVEAWAPLPDPDPATIQPMDAATAEALFLARFFQLTEGR